MVHRYLAEVQAELEAHLDPASGIDKVCRRNCLLASLKFSFENILPFSDPGVSEPADETTSQGSGQVSNRIPLLVKYLREYGDTNTAYNDIRPFVGRLKLDERTQFLSNTYQQ